MKMPARKFIKSGTNRSQVGTTTTAAVTIGWVTPFD